jgi:hypothetical protein
MIEQMMIGTMKGPPAFTISHMGPDYTGHGRNRHGKRRQAKG